MALKFKEVYDKRSKREKTDQELTVVPNTLFKKDMRQTDRTISELQSFKVKGENKTEKIFKGEIEYYILFTLKLNSFVQQK